MKVLIIDDDVVFAEKFEKDIKLFFYKYNTTICSKKAHTDFSLIDFNQKYQIAFIDIDLNNENGILLAHKIKACNPTCLIVFISAKQNLIHNTLEIQPFFFIRKQFYIDDLNTFFYLINKSLTEKSIIQLSYKSNKITLPIQEIIYIEATQHVLNVHTVDTVYQDNRTLKEMSTQLPNIKFLKTHRAFIVNCAYIHSITKGKVTLNAGANKKIEVLISCSYQQDFELKYQEYLLL